MPVRYQLSLLVIIERYHGLQSLVIIVICCLVEVVVGDLEKFIAEISKHIGLEWKSLARALGFEQTDIDAIEYKDVRNLKEQIFQMFHEWKRNNGSGATTTRLLSAIKHAELNKLLKTLREKAFIVPTLRGMY